MTNSCEYEYMEYTNEDAIDPNLICSICQKPFRDPVSTPCDHTYGRACITQWLTQSKNSSCPTCVQKPLTIKNLVQASRPLRNMLDKLRVQCILCGQNDIERGNFLDHINRFCLKATVACQAEDIKCPWKGLREELDEHISKCFFEPLRPVLSVLIEENRQLTNQVKKHSEQIKNLTQQMVQLNKTPTTPGAAAAAVESDGESDDSTASELTNDGISTKEGNSIYVRNLPCSVKFNEIFQFFSNVGRIHYDTHRKKVGVFIFKAINQTTGFCTAKVTYTNKESASAAVAEYDKKTVPQWNTCLSVSIFETRKKPTKIDEAESKETDSNPKKKDRQRHQQSRPSGKSAN